MPSCRVTVKWMGGKTFENIEVDGDQPPVLFKAQLASLSGVDVTRLKLILRGRVIKDDSWEGVALKDGLIFTMMGTVGEVVKAPTVQTTFIEDMKVEGHEAAAMAAALPSGLVNVGNTCYMNSTVQALRAVPELKDALIKYAGDSSDGSGKIAVSMRDLLGQLEVAHGVGVQPVALFSTLKSVYPQFASQDPSGAPQQQDAEECFSLILSSLANKLRAANASAAADAASSSAAAPSTDASNNTVDKLFDVTIRNSFENTEAQETLPETVEHQRKLQCFIRTQLSMMQEGIKLSLEGTVEMLSPSLQRTAVFKKTGRIVDLPPYLTVQFVRFEWKAAQQVKAKILKKIQFPFVLDVTEFCAPELQKEISATRTRLSTAENQTLPVLEATRTGFFELFAVVTHKGAYADGGHYVAWVKEKEGQWLMFDDDDVSVVKDDDIRQLVGGGEWHSAYLCIYRATSRGILRQ